MISRLPMADGQTKVIPTGPGIILVSAQNANHREKPNSKDYEIGI
ncbi:hypothetical protein [Pseudomonas sp. McL0111]